MMNSFTSYIEDNLAHAGISMPEARLVSLVEAAGRRPDAPAAIQAPGYTESEESHARRFTYYLIGLAFPLSEEEAIEAREALREATRLAHDASLVAA